MSTTIILRRASVAPASFSGANAGSEIAAPEGDAVDRGGSSELVCFYHDVSFKRRTQTTSYHDSAGSDSKLTVADLY